MPDLKLTFNFYTWVHKNADGYSNGAPVAICGDTTDCANNTHCPVIVPVLEHAVMTGIGHGVDPAQLDKVYRGSDGEWYDYNTDQKVPVRVPGSWPGSAPPNNMLDCGQDIVVGECDFDAAVAADSADAKTEASTRFRPLACGWKKVLGRWRWVC